MPKPLPTAGLDLTEPTTCPPLSAGEEFDEPAAIEVAARLKALADPARLRIITMLLSASNNELRTRDLSAALGIGEATTSHHLQQLINTGIVTKRRDGASVYYRINRPPLRALGRVIR